MKNLFSIILVVSCLDSYAQILEGGTYQFFTCKGRTERYIYYGGTTNPNTIYCPVQWTVVGGVIGTQTVVNTYTNSSTGQSWVDVTWTTDAPTGILSVTTSSCSRGGSSVTITLRINPTTLTAIPSTVDVGGQTVLAATSVGPTTSHNWSSPIGGNLNQTIGSTVNARPSLTTTYTCTIKSPHELNINGTTVKAISCNQNKTILVDVRPNISNNIISNSGNSLFFGSGDPSLLVGSLPNGSNGFFNYKWQSSITNVTTGFNDIPSATNQNYDPAITNQTTFYRRIVTSSSYTNISNIVSITIRPIGSDFDNPINLGNLDVCSQTGDNRSVLGYGNEYGNSFEDIFYKFNLARTAKVTIYNCKQDGMSSVFYLLDSNGIVIQGTEIESCDVGVQRDFDLQAGTYYVVTELQDNYTVTANFDLFVYPIISTSGNVTISAGNSTTLSVSGADSYTWTPATGLSSTTGSSVIASPSVSVVYSVRANSTAGCYVDKSIGITVSGSIGSTINNPIVATVAGCGYTSPFLNINGYGNDFGGPQIDVFFRFDLTSASEVWFRGFVDGGLHLTLLNNVGAFVAEEYYGWIDAGYDHTEYFFGELDGTPFKLTLQPGSYFLVSETQANQTFFVFIDTPTGYSCRKETFQPPTKLKSDGQNKLTDNPNRSITYPNPARDHVSFQLSQNLATKAYFISSAGIVCKEVAITEPTTAFTVNIKDLAAGLYFIRIVQGENVYSEKLVVEK